MRMLHWVVKTGDRTALADFFHNVLGMKPLRHEEFTEGCEAQCNGPYDGKWSKTMVGFGPEDQNFVIEITYNYNIKHYEYGNDVAYIKIKSRSAYLTVMDNIKTLPSVQEVGMKILDVPSPDGLVFRVLGAEDAPLDIGPVVSICLNVTDLQKSVAFWVDTVGFLEIDEGVEPSPFVTLSCSASSATLRLQQLPANKPLKRGTGYGRLALSCPTGDLDTIQESLTNAGYTILTPLVTLPTPGKADVKVVIAADPDGHEVCFVGDEGFRELSVVDDKASQLLGEAINKDGSKEWFEKKRVQKQKDGVAAAKKA